MKRDFSLKGRVEAHFERSKPCKVKRNLVKDAIAELELATEGLQLHGSWFYEFSTCNSDLDALALSFDEKGAKETESTQKHFLRNGLHLHKMNFREELPIDLCTGAFEAKKNRELNLAVKRFISGCKDKPFLRAVVAWSKHFKLNGPEYLNTLTWLIVANVSILTKRRRGRNDCAEMFQSFLGTVVPLLFDAKGTLHFKFPPGKTGFGAPIEITKHPGGQLEINFMGNQMVPNLTVEKRRQMVTIAQLTDRWLRNYECESLPWAFSDSKMCSHCTKSNPLLPLFAEVELLLEYYLEADRESLLGFYR